MRLTEGQWAQRGRALTPSAHCPHSCLPPHCSSPSSVVSCARWGMTATREWHLPAARGTCQAQLWALAWSGSSRSVRATWPIEKRPPGGAVTGRALCQSRCPPAHPPPHPPTRLPTAHTPTHGCPRPLHTPLARLSAQQTAHAHNLSPQALLTRLSSSSSSSPLPPLPPPSPSLPSHACPSLPTSAVLTAFAAAVAHVRAAIRAAVDLVHLAAAATLSASAVSPPLLLCPLLRCPVRRLCLPVPPRVSGSPPRRRQPPPASASVPPLRRPAAAQQSTRTRPTTTTCSCPTARTTPTAPSWCPCAVTQPPPQPRLPPAPPPSPPAAATTTATTAAGAAAAAAAANVPRPHQCHRRSPSAPR